MSEIFGQFWQLLFTNTNMLVGAIKLWHGHQTGRLFSFMTKVTFR